MQVESEQGTGTTFTIYFPRLERTTEEGMETTAAQPTARGRETVLVVEDNDMIRNLVGRILRGEGYTVLVAKHGPEALQVSRNQRGPIDLLLTDMMMPDMNGEQLAERLASSWPNLNLLYMSGYSSEDFASGRDRHEGNFLEKPFTTETLTAAVRRALVGAEERA